MYLQIKIESDLAQAANELKLPGLATERIPTEYRKNIDRIPA